MNKKASMHYIFVSCALISVLITGIFFYENSTAGNYYILREYEGQLAVFINDSDIPSEILPQEFDSFSLKDKEKLKAGIKAQSEAELYRLIEDFSG